MAGRKFTYEEIKNFIEVESDSGCKLLSESYINSKQKLEIKCKCDDVFKTAYSSFKHSKKMQCNKCSRGNFAAKNRISIEYINSFIKENCKGVSLLSEQYNNNREKLEFRCSCGNTFHANWDNFSSGRVRRKCADCVKLESKSRERRKWNYETVKEFIEVESNSGCKLVSREYVNDREKLDILCACNDIYQVTFDNFKRSKQFQCPKCGKEKASLSQAYTIDEIHSMLRDRKCEFKLISNTYTNCKEKLEFMCSCGNVFINSLDEVLSSFKQKCNECSFREAGIKSRLLYEDVKMNIELDDGFTLLSDSYESAIEKLEIMCSNNHIFSMSYNNFIGRRSCPVCMSSEPEKNAYEKLRDMKVDFEREKTFDGLVSDLGSPLRFDFSVLNDGELIFLVELDGEQHYRPIDLFGGENVFKTQQIHDKRKNQYCKDNNIPLLRIPYWEFDNIEQILDKWLNTYSLV